MSQDERKTISSDQNTANFSLELYAEASFKAEASSQLNYMIAFGSQPTI